MSFVKCFDAVEMVVEEANKQFAPIWKMNKERYKILKQYCDVIDSLSSEYNGESYEVEIDDIAMTVAITMDCDDMIVDQQNHKFTTLAQRTVSIGFSVSEEGKLAVKFVFPSLWERS